MEDVEHKAVIAAEHQAFSHAAMLCKTYRASLKTCRLWLTVSLSCNFWLIVILIVSFMR